MKFLFHRKKMSLLSHLSVQTVKFYKYILSTWANVLPGMLLGKIEGHQSLLPVLLMPSY